jgi:Uncharacterized conserved protein
METLTINENIFKTHRINLYGSALMIIEGGKGFLACGYVNLQAAEKLGHAAAIVTGVKNFDDMLNAEVIAASSAAAALGVTVGMKGADAAALLI